MNKVNNNEIITDFKVFQLFLFNNLEQEKKVNPTDKDFLNHKYLTYFRKIKYILNNKLINDKTIIKKYQQIKESIFSIKTSANELEVVLRMISATNLLLVDSKLDNLNSDNLITISDIYADTLPEDMKANEVDTLTFY